MALLLTAAIIIMYEFRKKFDTIFDINIGAALTALHLIFGIVGTTIIHFVEYIFQDIDEVAANV